MITPHWTQGLLSGHGMRILDYCCGVAADHPEQPIDLWSSVEEEVGLFGPKLVEDHVT